MTNLEFIEKEINHLEMILSCMVGITAKKELTSKLQQLEQIKIELEFRVKKPFIKDFKTISYGCYKPIYLCPHCKEEISQSQKYCHECGQAIIINQREENKNE